MTSKLDLLAPPPQKLSSLDGQVLVSADSTIVLQDTPQELLFAAEWLQDALSRNGIGVEISAAPLSSTGNMVLALDPALCVGPQSYRLLVEPQGVFLVGADAAGVFYGVCTLCQLLDLYADDGDSIALPTLHIEDWPDLPNRGVMLDISRDRVPTMQSLYEMVDMLAGLKVNQLQLYIEHTFAYAGHEVVWKDASPMTGEEILMLDEYCRARHMELVPNQNSFGHMHRWLTHEEYRHLAEAPDGIKHPFTAAKEPYSLCPMDPGSLDLLADLYAQLLPHFSSRQFNVGLDETFDLGVGRSKEICEAQGTGRVYLDFLNKVHDLTTRHGRTMQFWSDIIVRNEPDLVAELPRDVIALEWGYDVDYPFAENTRLIAESGRSFYVCPGTSSWNSLAGRTDNALGNLRNAAVNGLANGAIGYLNTDWGDHGHLQPPPVSYLGYLAGAAMSWNAAAAGEEAELDWAAALDAHIFRDRRGVMGRLACDMGRVYLKTGASLHNSSPLFWLAIIPDALPEYRRPQGLTAARLEETLAYIDEVMVPIGSSDMQRPDAVLIQAEYEWAADMLRWACRLGIARLDAGLDCPIDDLAPDRRAQLADEVVPLIERHRELWLQRSRPGGLQDSAGRLEHMLAHLSGGTEA